MSKDLTSLSDYVFNTVGEIIRGNEAKGIIPTDAQAEDIYNAVKTDVQQCLNEFVKDGILVFHRTLNSISFYFKDLPTDETE